jgi:hypothetical protein
MDKAVLEPRFDAVPIYQAVNRQPSLLRSCRPINFWQSRISLLRQGKTSRAEQINN